MSGERKEEKDKNEKDKNEKREKKEYKLPPSFIADPHHHSPETVPPREEKKLTTAEATPESAEKHSTRNMLIFLGIVVVIIVGIIALRAVLKDPSPETVEYNGFVFTYLGGSWYTQWQANGQPFNIPFRYNPQQVVNVTVAGALDPAFTAEEIYVTFDPEQERLQYVALAAGELGISLAQTFSLTLIPACTKNLTEACAKIAIVDCANKDKAVVKIQQANETKVLLDDNCVTIMGKDLELVRAVDRVLYQWYRIM